MQIIRGLAMGLAMIMYGREEGAETLIEQMSRDQDPILRSVFVTCSSSSFHHPDHVSIAIITAPGMTSSQPAPPPPPPPSPSGTHLTTLTMLSPSICLFPHLLILSPVSLPRQSASISSQQINCNDCCVIKGRIIAWLWFSKCQPFTSPRSQHFLHSMARS